MLEISAAWLRVISAVLLLLVWGISALFADDRVLPDPWSVAIVFYDHLINGTLLSDLGITLWRVSAAFILAMATGTVIGILMGLRKRLDILLDGWLILFLNIPALVTIILCYVWFGLTEVAAIIAVSLNKFPNVVVTLREGTRAVDKDLLQVAQVFRVSHQKNVSQILPATIVSIHYDCGAFGNRFDLENRVSGRITRTQQWYWISTQRIFSNFSTLPVFSLTPSHS